MVNFELQKAKKKIRQAIDGKYAQKTTTTVAAAVGTRHVAIDGNLASATLPDGSSGAVEVINAGRLASARYELRTGGTVSVVSGGGGGSGGGSGISFSEADTRYYTKSQLDIGQLDIRYYTETESDALFVPVVRTVTGSGALSGGGALSSNQTITMNTPGSLTATSTNNSAVTNHTHAIDSTIARSAINLSASGLGFSGGGDLTANRSFTLASSSNPGATAAILATSAGGTLTLNNSGSTTTPALVIGDGATGRLAIGSSGWRDNATQLEMLGTRTLYVGSNPVGGTNWDIDAAGAVSASAGVTSAHTFGVGTIGQVGGYTSYFGFAANAFNTANSYALLHSVANGSTFLNAASGQIVYHRIANVDVMNMTATGLDFVASSYVGASNYASQTTGWRIGYTGGADFRYLFVDEMHAKSFIADLEQALAGGQIIAKSVAVLYLDFTAPAAAAATTLTVRDLPSATGMATFVNGDMIRVRNFSRASGSLTIADCWGTVVLDTTYGTSGYDSATKTQRYTFTRSAGTIGGGNAPGAMAAGVVVKADAIILDYGVSGNGLYEVNAVDGAYGANSPYAQIARWTGHPATGTVVNGRFGKLSGLTIGVANEMGIAVGSGFTTGDQYFKASNVGVVQNNVNSTWRSGGTTFLEIDSSSGVDITIPDDAPMYSRGYSFKNSGGTNISSLWAWYLTVDSSNRLELFAGYAARKNMIDVIASSDSTHDADILLRAAGRGQQADMFMLTSTSGSSVNFSGITSLFSVDAPQVNFSNATTFLINPSVTADTYLRFSSFTDTYIKSTYNATGTLRYIDISAGATSRVRLGNGNGFSLEADTNTVDVNGKLYSSGIVEVGQGRTSGNISRFTGRNTTVSSISLTATTGFYGAAIGFNAHHANDSVPPTASGAFKFLGTQYTGNVTRPGMQFWNGHNGIMSWYYGEAGLASSADVTTWTKTFEISTTLVNSQLPITVSGGTELIKLNGSGTSGNASQGYIAFYDSNTTTRRGFIGDASSENTDIYLRADTSALHLGDSTSIDVIVLSSGGTKILGNIGFYNTTPIAKQTVTGSRGGNAALASLLTALASHGLITNSSTA